MRYLNDLSFSRGRLNRTISPRDSMRNPRYPEQYYDLGARALDLVLFASQLCAKPHFPRILDLPCGYGRVLRWLRAHFDYADITACDLDQAAIDFCAREFQVNPVVSQPDLRRLEFARPFDLIWVGSLFTHLRREAWLAALECLIHWTAEDGILVFSTHGRCFTSLLARGRRDIADDVDVRALIAEYGADGFSFQPYYASSDGTYGVSATSSSWVHAQLAQYPDVILRAHLEEAWGLQDVYILYKAAGYYERLTPPHPS
ncbi:MAG: hypothetical protein A3G75_04945 [Verrucomicrobia bacterium RIFCSPLOWO2_12_FULL_64_8]|nr:MAG: hypothetical protein A3G75_04945 [Verrucomicrobia bacterium RIFCSPLOWO2_12_FULL_64_8]